MRGKTYCNIFVDHTWAVQTKDGFVEHSVTNGNDVLFTVLEATEITLKIIVLC